MKKRWRIILIALCMITATALVAVDSTKWSIYRLKSVYRTISSTSIPTSFDDVTMVFFSDLHAFGYFSLADTQKIINKINALSPDIIVFGGDLIDVSASGTLTEDEINQLTNQLASLKAPLGKFAVSGLQDIDQSSMLNDIYANSDFELLQDSGIKLHNNSSESINLIGLMPFKLGSILNENAFDSVAATEFTITVCATPGVVESLPADKTNWLLSGSTHGGQINLPFIGPLYKTGETHYLSGRYTVGTTNLIVSNGTSTSEFNARFLRDPDIQYLRFETTPEETLTP